MRAGRHEAGLRRRDGHGPGVCKVGLVEVGVSPGATAVGAGPSVIGRGPGQGEGIGVWVTTGPAHREELLEGGELAREGEGVRQPVLLGGRGSGRGQLREGGSGWGREGGCLLERQ